MRTNRFYCSRHRECVVDCSAETIDAKGPDLAAAEYVELNMANLDYPDTVEIYVRAAFGGGKIEKYSVNVISIPCATATKVE